MYRNPRLETERERERERGKTPKTLKREILGSKSTRLSRFERLQKIYESALIYVCTQLQQKN